MNPFDFLFSQLADMFTSSGSGNIEQVTNNLFGLPLPPLNDPMVRETYAITWALGILFAIVAGAFSAFVKLGSSSAYTGNSISVVNRWLFFLRVVIAGVVIPPAVAGALYLSDVVARSSLALVPVDEKFDWINRISIFAVFTDAIGGAVTGLIIWICAWILTGVTAFMIFMVLPATVMTPVFYGLSIAGAGGLRMWRWWLSLLSVTIIVKPAVAWTLVLGNVFITWAETIPVFNVVVPWFAVGTILFATAVPFKLFGLLKDNTFANIRAAGTFNGTVTDTSGRGVAFRTASAAAVGVGAYAMRQRMNTPTSLDSPGGVRGKTGQSLTSAGMMLARKHPTTAVAAQSAAVVFNASAKRAEQKKRMQQSVNNPTNSP